MIISGITSVKIGDFELDVKEHPGYLTNIEILDNGVLHYTLTYEDCSGALVVTEHFYNGEFEITYGK